MCHDADSRPPAPPVVGAVQPGEQLELVAADGNHFAAWSVFPEGAARAGVVILPDVRGLHPYYLALTERFAEAGLAAIAIDYFGRTDGVAIRDDSFDWQSRMAAGATSGRNVQADAAAAVQRLHDQGITDVFTVGFCFGGGNSWRLAASDLPLAGVIGFYGRPDLARRVLPNLHLPMLLLIAGADQGIPIEDSQGLLDELSAAGKVHEGHVYEGAPHSFFDRSFAEFGWACDDAWTRILGFVDRFGPSRV